MDTRTLKTVNWRSGLLVVPEHFQQVESYGREINRSLFRLLGGEPGLVWETSQHARESLEWAPNRDAPDRLEVTVEYCVAASRGGDLLVVDQQSEPPGEQEYHRVRGVEPGEVFRVVLRPDPTKRKGLPNDPMAPALQRNPQEPEFLAPGVQLRIRTLGEPLTERDFVLGQVIYNGGEQPWSDDEEFIPFVRHFEALEKTRGFKQHLVNKMQQLLLHVGDHARNKAAPGRAWFLGNLLWVLGRIHHEAQLEPSSPWRVAHDMASLVASVKAALPLLGAPSVSTPPERQDWAETGEGNIYPLLRFLEETVDWLNLVVDKVFEVRDEKPDDYRVDRSLTQPSGDRVRLQGKLRKVIGLVPFRPDPTLANMYVARGLMKVPVNVLLVFFITPKEPGLVQMQQPLDARFCYVDANDNNLGRWMSTGFRVDVSNHVNYDYKLMLKGVNATQIRGLRLEVSPGFEPRSLMVLQDPLIG